MQKRTSRLKFGHFAQKSVLNSVSNLSTKGVTTGTSGGATGAGGWTRRMAGGGTVGGGGGNAGGAKALVRSEGTNAGANLGVA